MTHKSQVNKPKELNVNRMIKNQKVNRTGAKVKNQNIWKYNENTGKQMFMVCFELVIL